jgi:ABC-2 type transport system permease protein
MRKYYYILVKEFLQIIRDLPGLGLLFLMPAVMLVVITLTQEKVMIGMDSDTNIILVNSDLSALGNSIELELQENSSINLDLFDSAEEAEKKVFKGDYQILVIVPDSATEKLERLARQHASDTVSIIASEMQMISGIRLLYDPAMMKIYKDIMSTSLQIIIESIAAEIYMETFKEALQNNISDQFNLFLEDFIPPDFELELPDFPGREKLVSIEEEIAGGQEYLLEYSIVKNNVPAFILFAMFFIVLPLAGSILNEKQQGTKDRIMTLPVTWLTLFSGKITVYLLVCILQFFMMILIGRYILPLISTLPPLSLDVNIFALMVITIASGLAAIGFGLMIGTFSSTYLQAAPIGSVLVVILAVLGGIFVPNYMMPDLISKISIISPLRWGADAFYSIFARNADVEMVLKQFISLLAFFLTTLILSFSNIRRRP